MTDGQALAYARLVTDGAGVSRFAVGELPLPEGPVVPPNPAAAQGEAMDVSSLVVVRLPAGWSRTHTAPARQWVFVLAGTAEVTAGGEVRRFGPGAVVLAEDTEGAGHTTTALDELTLAVVRI